MAEKKFKIGDFVRLSAEGRKQRVTEMESWEGTVEDVREFSCVRGETLEHHKWVVVDWGVHREGKKPFVWLEKPEHLTVS